MGEGEYINRRKTKYRTTIIALKCLDKINSSLLMLDNRQKRKTEAPLMMVHIPAKRLLASRLEQGRRMIEVKIYLQYLLVAQAIPE
jgi:hypothetical protein